MTYDPETLANLSALCDAATPGPWRYEIDNVFAGPDDNSTYVADCAPMGGPEEGRPGQIANAAFIAAAHPLAVKALIGEIERLAAENARLREWSDVAGRGLEANAARERGLLYIIRETRGDTRTVDADWLAKGCDCSDVEGLTVEQEAYARLCALRLRHADPNSTNRAAQAHGGRG